MNSHFSIAAIAALCAIMPTQAATEQQATLSKNYQSIDANKPVLCLLPGRVRKVGNRMTYLERRKPGELTASECEIRGGEYTLYDRANYENALAVWMEGANAGDASAQIYVGEIYEKGWLGAPDFNKASHWYGMAAEQGDRRAQRRMAYFYENGLGVSKDTGQALALWRDALNLDDDLVLASEVAAAKSDGQRQIDKLLAALERQNLSTGRLQRTLEDAQTTLASQGEQLQREQQALIAVQSELKSKSNAAVDTNRVRELEEQLSAGQSELDEQQLAIELLEASVGAQQAQLAASMRQGEVRQRQLSKARKALETEALRGDALLRKLENQGREVKSVEQQLALANQQLLENRDKQSALNIKIQESRSTSDKQSASEQAQLRRQLAAAQEEVGKSELNLEKLQKQLRQQRSGFENQLASASLREADLSSALASSKAEKAKLGAQLKSAQARAENLDATLAKSRYALADAEADAASLNEAIDNLGKNDTVQLQKLNASLKKQEKVIAKLSAQRNELQANWKKVARERDEVRQTLASEVDKRSWYEIELESAKSKLASAQNELQLLDQGMRQARFEKRQLGSDMQRLEQDLARNQARSYEDLQQMEQELKRTRLMLADADTGLNTIRRERERVASDVDMWGERQQEQVFAMRGVPSDSPIVTADKMPKIKRKGSYRAVIIANYQYDYLPDLATPPHDAQRLKQLLERRYGFKVEVKINLNRSEMFKLLSSVRDFREKDFVMLYYAGHGKMDEYGDGYWLPTDFREGDAMSEAVSSGDLTQTLSQSPAKHVLVIADSCYSGALVRNTSPTINKSIPALMKYWMANKSRTVLTSGGLKPVLDEGPGDNSVFASALLSVLSANPGAINGELLYAKVHGLVREEAARMGYLDQVPQFAAIEDAGHENGQFVFIPQG